MTSDWMTKGTLNLQRKTLSVLSLYYLLSITYNLNQALLFQMNVATEVTM